jgi:hypothetical protein
VEKRASCVVVGGGVNALDHAPMGWPASCVLASCIMGEILPRFVLDAPALHIGALCTRVIDMMRSIRKNTVLRIVLARFTPDQAPAACIMPAPHLLCGKNRSRPCKTSSNGNDRDLFLGEKRSAATKTATPVAYPMHRRGEVRGQDPVAHRVLYQ